MSNDSYDDWAERYGTAFGLKSDEEAESLRSWQEHFRRQGVTAEQLNAATDWLMQHDPPRFLSDHLPALTMCLARQREQQQQREQPDMGECVLCRGVGMISVPSLSALANEMWDTQAVLCRCALGAWIGRRQGGDRADGTPRPTMMGIDEYERRLPNWKELVSIHDAESIRILKEKRGNYGAQHISLALDEALERLEQRRRAADAAAGRESRDAEEGRGTRDERRGAATPDAGQETSGEERWPKAATEFLPRPSSPYFDARQWAEPMMRQRRDSAAAAPPPPSAAAAEGRRQPDEGSGAQQRDEGQGDARGL